MRQLNLSFACVVGVFVLVMNTPASAGVSSHLIRETTELLGKRFGREAAEMGTRTLSSQVARIAAKYGDDGLRALKNCGPRAIKVIDAAGPNGPAAARLLGRYGDEMLTVATRPSQLSFATSLGDDAARLLARHGAVTEPLLKAHGKIGVKALSQLNSRNVRRMAMLEGDGVLKQIPKCDSVLETVARFGDRGCEFLWGNKLTLCLAGTGTAATAAFLADPEPFINGTKDLAITVSELTAETIAKPLVQAAAAEVPWGPLAFSLPVLLGVLLFPSALALGGWCYRKRRLPSGKQ